MTPANAWHRGSTPHGQPRASGKAQHTFRPNLPVLRSLAIFAGGKHQTRVDGRPRDENAFAGVSGTGSIDAVTASVTLRGSSHLLF